MGSLWKPIDFCRVSIVFNPVAPKNTYTWYGGFPDDNVLCFQPIHFLFYRSIYMGSL